MFFQAASYEGETHRIICRLFCTPAGSWLTKGKPPKTKRHLSRQERCLAIWLVGSIFARLQDNTGVYTSTIPPRIL